MKKKRPCRVLIIVVFRDISSFFSVLKAISLTALGHCLHRRLWGTKYWGLVWGMFSREVWWHGVICASCTIVRRSAAHRELLIGRYYGTAIPAKNVHFRAVRMVSPIAQPIGARGDYAVILHGRHNTVGSTGGVSLAVGRDPLLIGSTDVVPSHGVAICCFSNSIHEFGRVLS